MEMMPKSDEEKKGVENEMKWKKQEDAEDAENERRINSCSTAKEERHRDNSGKEAGEY